MHTVATVAFVVMIVLYVGRLIQMVVKDAARKRLRRQDQTPLPLSPGALPGRYSFKKGEKAPGPSFLG